MRTKTGPVDTGRNTVAAKGAGFGFAAHADAAKGRMESAQVSMHLTKLMERVRDKGVCSHSC